MKQLLEFFRTTAGTVVLVLVVAGTLLGAIYVVRQFIKGDTLEDARYTWFVDAETGKPFRHLNQEGDMNPILAPSGKNTGWPAEACYWTADGGTKKEPTYVLLNECLGKHEPTYCPDCGRLVRGHNPMPGPGVSPPPKRGQ